MAFANQSGGAGERITQNATGVLFAPFRKRVPMKKWTPKLKHYPHFDKYLREEEIFRIVTTPELVAANAFFPFLLFNKNTERFGRKKKSRPIRYAARRDAYIFAYYRHILSKFYEAKLLELGIQDCPIAYRKMPATAGNLGGKCNIHFAKEAFQKIQEMGSCYAVAMDISSYFESLEHIRLEKLWCELLSKDTLPPDHRAVFKAITKYTVVDLDECYERLGYKGEVEIDGKKKWGFTIDPKQIPKQLCSMKDFRDKICGRDKQYSQLTRKNIEDYGIPQGSPISDLLANIYLLYFDKEINDFASEKGCYYRRYSDDILFICPPIPGLLDEAVSKIKDGIKRAGEQLQIKDAKTNIAHFVKTTNGIIAKSLQPENKQKPFEYLGFAFDGNTVKLRDSTLSKYYRKMTIGIRVEAIKLVARYTGKSKEEILKLANINRLYQRYGKIKDFDSNSDYTQWNFWTYAKRASDIMEPLGNIILQQLRNHRKKVETLLEQEIEKEHQKRRPKSRVEFILFP